MKFLQLLFVTYCFFFSSWSARRWPALNLVIKMMDSKALSVQRQVMKSGVSRRHVIFPFMPAEKNESIKKKKNVELKISYDARQVRRRKPLRIQSRSRPRMQEAGIATRSLERKERRRVARQSFHVHDDLVFRVRVRVRVNRR
jgi:hypothetical protein